jgi:hypothetical protein
MHFSLTIEPYFNLFAGKNKELISPDIVRWIDQRIEKEAPEAGNHGITF